MQIGRIMVPILPVMTRQQFCGVGEWKPIFTKIDFRYLEFKTPKLDLLSKREHGIFLECGTLFNT